MRRLITVGLLLAAWPLAAAAYPQGLFSSPLPSPVPKKLQALQHHFSQVQVLVLHFRQEKHLPELKQPLVSHGVLTIVPSLGVDWQVTQPFKSQWKVTRSGRVLKGPDNGAPQAVANLLIGLFSADTGKLKSAFRLFWSERPPGWWLGLKPRDPRLARAISDVAVSGGERVRQVEVDESGGDRTVITFTRQQAHPLTPAVRKRFSQG